MSRAPEMRTASALATAAAGQIAESVQNGYEGRALLTTAQQLRDAADLIDRVLAPVIPVLTRTVGVRAYGKVAITWNYLVVVDAGLTDEEAHAEAIRAVKAGDVDSYDTVITGDTTGSGRTYGTDILEEWQTRPATWGAS